MCCVPEKSQATSSLLPEQNGAGMSAFQQFGGSLVFFICECKASFAWPEVERQADNAEISISSNKR